MNCHYSTGNARITSRGIHFLNCYYTCGRAISGRWYEQAELHGETEIGVIYTPQDLTKLLILPVGANGEFDVAEAIVQERLPSSKLEKYFQSIQILKSMRKFNKKRKVKVK
jgi:hypothetical protein